MPKLFIHVGLPKTATTFLQSSYFPQLLNVQFYGKGGRSYFSDLDSYDARSSNILISQEEMTAQTWEKKNQIKRGTTELVHWADTFGQAIINLKRIFPSAHLLIMFRRQGDFVVSLWRSHLMMGGQESFLDFYGPGKLFREEDLLIAPKMEVIRREFGNNATFLSFEEFKQQGVAYMHAFFEGQGIYRGHAVKTKKPPKPELQWHQASGSSPVESAIQSAAVSHETVTRPSRLKAKNCNAKMFAVLESK